MIDPPRDYVRLRPSVTERLEQAERLHRDRVAGERQADEVLDAGRARYHRDPVAHARVELAARVVEHYLGRESREAALEAASVTLELVERDRPTAEAKLARLNDTLAAWLASPSASAQHAARVILELLGDDQASRGEEDLTPRDRAELLIAGTLAGAGAAAPVELTGRLLAMLDREGLAIARRPAL